MTMGSKNVPPAPPMRLQATQKPTPDPRSSVENSSGGYTNSNTEAAEIIKLKVEMQISAQRVGIPCQTVMVSRAVAQR